MAEVEGGKAVKGREMHFALYRAFGGDDGRPSTTCTPTNSFDLSVVDECHRGSAGYETRWRDTLLHFTPAYQRGLTDAPLREGSRDSNRYFGTRSIRTPSGGVEDGFLTPTGSAGWSPRSTPTGGGRPRGNPTSRGRPILDELYPTKDFERVVSLDVRTETVARHPTDYLKATDRYAKTIVFCVDQDHASRMRQFPPQPEHGPGGRGPAAGVGLRRPGDRRRGGGRWRVPERRPGHREGLPGRPDHLPAPHHRRGRPDVPERRLVRAVGTMTEFKQIIGRGTRTREEYGRLFFTILDYPGSANEKVADPAFDGIPEEALTTEIDEYGQNLKPGPPPGPRTAKCRTHGELGAASAEFVQDLDADGKKLRAVEITHYAGEAVRTLYTGPDDLRPRWAAADERAAVVAELGRGIALTVLAADAPPTGRRHV